MRYLEIQFQSSASIINVLDKRAEERNKMQNSSRKVALVTGANKGIGFDGIVAW
jgi:hypothetical protein